VPESGEFKRGKLVEGKETWVLSTYGKIIGITRQAIINDDLGAFTRTPFLLGQEVAMLEADTVVGIITANGNLADGVALFEATTHKNLIAAGAAISVDAIGAVRVLMPAADEPGREDPRDRPEVPARPRDEGPAGDAVLLDGLPGGRVREDQSVGRAAHPDRGAAPRRVRQ